MNPLRRQKKQRKELLLSLEAYSLYKSDSCAHPVGKEREILPLSLTILPPPLVPRRLTVLCEARRIDV